MISQQTWALREKILQQLGGKCVCACGCQERNLRRLELHHTEGGGKKDRAHVRGVNLYSRLLKQLDAGVPLNPPFSLLCFNCHGELTRLGTCDGGLISIDAELTGGSGEHGARRHVTMAPSRPPDPFAYLKVTYTRPDEPEEPKSFPTPPRSFLSRLLKGSP